MVVAAIAAGVAGGAGGFSGADVFGGGYVPGSGRPVIVVAPCGVGVDLEELLVVLDAHHGANGEGDWPGDGGRGWDGECGSHGRMSGLLVAAEG